MAGESAAEGQLDVSLVALKAFDMCMRGWPILTTRHLDRTMLQACF